MSAIQTVNVDNPGSLLEICHSNVTNAQWSNDRTRISETTHPSLPDFTRGLPLRPSRWQRSTGSSSNGILSDSLHTSNEMSLDCQPAQRSYCVEEQFPYGAGITCRPLVADREGSLLNPYDLAAEVTRTKGPRAPAAPPPAWLNSSTTESLSDAVEDKQFHHPMISESGHLTSTWEHLSQSPSASAADFFRAPMDYTGDPEYDPEPIDNPYDVFLEDHQPEAQVSTSDDPYADSYRTSSWSQQQTNDDQVLPSQSLLFETSMEGDIVATGELSA